MFTRPMADASMPPPPPFPMGGAVPVVSNFSAGNEMPTFFNNAHVGPRSRCFFSFVYWRYFFYSVIAPHVLTLGSDRRSEQIPPPSLLDLHFPSFDLDRGYGNSYASYVENSITGNPIWTPLSQSRQPNAQRPIQMQSNQSQSNHSEKSTMVLQKHAVMPQKEETSTPIHG